MLRLGEQEWSGTGNGPLSALDNALRDALVTDHPAVANYRLVDYRVRILDQGASTDSLVRVLIDTDNEDQTWTTVGLGTNVVEASWEALADAYLYGLVKHYS